jgi:S1-C subfamily serine protease
MNKQLKLTFAIFLAVNTGTASGSSVKNAIVKIYTTFNTHNYHDPWQMKGQRSRSGSGCIIKGGRILTNAHVVSDSTFIQVKKTGSAKKYVASVESISHSCDLAILKVHDSDFFKGATTLSLGSLPEVQDKVAVYGFPIGGIELSITEGVVSRVEHLRYTHSNANLLTCQIDAAVNPGNSGGPVVKDGRIVGVAFQAGRGENIGYMVPVPVIQHFMKDISDSDYSGIPALGISWQKTESPDLREKYKMQKNQTGILVNKVYPRSPAEGALLKGDIILSIDGNSIANDGTIEFRKGERTSFGHIVQQKQIGGNISISALREGTIFKKKIKLTETIDVWQLVPHEQYDTPPTYFITGGLVFTTLTANLLDSWGRNVNRAPIKLVNYYVSGEPSEERKQIVILLKVLADETNMGYHDLSFKIVEEVNGRQISVMNDLVSITEQNDTIFNTFVFEDSSSIVIEREKAAKQNPSILDNYMINSDRSADLPIDNK